MNDDNNAVSCEKLEQHTISSKTMRASIVNYGASLRSLHLEGINHSLVLGHRDPENYPVGFYYLGAIAGRVANRIADGKFILNTKQYDLDRNFQDRHCLHGGLSGPGKRYWHVIDKGDNFIAMNIVDEEAHTGFPGKCATQVTYELHDDAALEIRIISTCDTDTPVNFAPHPYFNLAGSGKILDHEISILADHYLPVDDALIPTGEIAPVTGTEFDLLKWAKMSKKAGGYDHNFCLANERTKTRPVAKVRVPNNSIEMQVETSEPGLQFYSGAGLGTNPADNSENFIPYGGFCLEPQNWPDAINQTHFPDSVLRAGETLTQTTIYRFTQN